MLIAVLILFFNFFLLGLDKEQSDDSFVQADFYIESLENNPEATEYFWSLNELASGNPEVEKYIYKALKRYNLDIADFCHFNSFTRTKSLGTATKRKQERLRLSFECFGDPFLYIAYLYELPESEALNYDLKFGTRISLNSTQQALINKAVGKPYNINNLFSSRTFELSDIYLFHKLNFESGQTPAINDLLDKWTALLYRQSNNELIDQLMLASVINGESHHSSKRSSRDNKIYDLLRMFDRSLLLPNSHFKLNLYKRIGFSTYYTGNYRDALQFYRNQLIPLSEIIDNKEEQLIIRLDYGSMQYRIDNIQEALKEYELVYNDTTGIQSNRHRSAMHNNLAVAYLNNGDFNKYLQFQLDALDESITSQYTSGQLLYLNNLYIYYRKNESWSSATSYLNEAAHIAELSEENVELSKIKRSQALYERDKNQNFKKALALLESSESLINDTDNYNQLIFTKTELYRTYLMLSNHGKALIILNELSDLSKEKGDQNIWLNTQAWIADMHLEQGNVSDAEPYIEHLKKGSLEDFYFLTSVKAANVLSRYYFLTDNPHKALSIAQSYSEEIMERLENSADYQSGHLRMDSEFIENFQLVTDLLLHLERPTQTLAMLDEIKNISRFSFYNNPTLKSNILNEEELIHDIALGNRIERLRNELNEAPKSERVGINNQISHFITEKKILKDRVLSNVDDISFDLQKVQNKLKRDEVMLYFTFFNQQMYLATISSSDIEFTSETFSDTEMQRVEQTIDHLSNGNTNLYDLNWIHNKLLKGKFDKSYSKLFVVPDGFLYRLPLEVLPTEKEDTKHSYGSAHYLIEDHAITYVNSLKDFEDSNDKFDHNTDYLGFGISDFEGFQSNMDHNRPLAALPFAEQEVKNINETMTRLSTKETYTAGQGTEKAFRGQAGNSRIMHIASHSEVFHPDPLYSVIYMHSEDGKSDYRDDGLVYAYELFEMDLSNEMVMLSSCESGSGSYIQGSGIVGLSRAFTYAGAQSLVMNLWSVRDQTASAMAVSFYEYLNEGYSKDEALRQAKINYINTSSSDPYLWGSYVIYGDDSPLVSRPLLDYWWVWGVGIMFISIIWFSGRMLLPGMNNFIPKASLPWNT